MGAKDWVDLVVMALGKRVIIMRYYPFVPLIAACLALWQHFKPGHGWEAWALAAVVVLVLAWIPVWTADRVRWVRETLELDKSIYFVHRRTMKVEEIGDRHLVTAYLTVRSMIPLRVEVDPQGLVVSVDGGKLELETMKTNPSGPVVVEPMGERDIAITAILPNARRDLFVEERVLPAFVEGSLGISEGGRSVTIKTGSDLYGDPVKLVKVER